MNKYYILTLSLLIVSTQIHPLTEAEFIHLMQNGTYQELRNAADLLDKSDPRKKDLKIMPKMFSYKINRPH